MNILTFARLGCLAMAALASPLANADSDMAAALSNCRNEAMSTGLQEEADIKAYIDICMQAWQMPPGYVDPAVPADANPETPQAEVPEAAAQ